MKIQNQIGQHHKLPSSINMCQESKLEVQVIAIKKIMKDSQDSNQSSY